MVDMTSKVPVDTKVSIVRMISIKFLKVDA